MRTRDLIREKNRINKEILALQKEYEAKEEDLTSQYKAVMKQLRKQCKHPPDKIKKEETYCSGSYYDKEYWEHWIVCSICGAESKKERSYGSYG